MRIDAFKHTPASKAFKVAFTIAREKWPTKRLNFVGVGDDGFCYFQEQGNPQPFKFSESELLARVQA